MLETWEVGVGGGESRLRAPLCVRWSGEKICVLELLARALGESNGILALVYGVLMGAGRPSTERIDNRHVICTISFSKYIQGDGKDGLMTHTVCMIGKPRCNILQKGFSIYSPGPSGRK